MTLTRDLRRIQTAVYRKYFESDTIGLPIERLLVLDYVARTGAVYQTQIGRECAIDRSTMGPLLKAMSNSGLVEVNRDEEDRRVKLVTITAKGMKVMKTARDDLESAEVFVMRLIDRDQIPLRKHIHTLSNVLDATQVDSRG